MKEPILVVLAAGIGSRFGGLKQMTPFGAHGESLIDYSLFDALRAGFQRVVFIVNGKIKDDFREIVGKNVENRMEVHYALQEIDKLPEGFTVPEGRSKPWGTAHAVLCAKDVIDAPFCALNGDDFYGRQALQHMYTFLSANQQPGSYTMVGYSLANTLSEYGYVSRGRCLVDENNYLQDVEELNPHHLHHGRPPVHQGWPNLLQAVRRHHGIHEHLGLYHGFHHPCRSRLCRFSDASPTDQPA